MYIIRQYTNLDLQEETTPETTVNEIADDDLGLHDYTEQVLLEPHETCTSTKTHAYRRRGKYKYLVDYSVSPIPWWSVKNLDLAVDVALLPNSTAVVTENHSVKLYAQGRGDPSHVLDLREPRGVCYDITENEILVVDSSDCKVFVLAEADLEIKKTINLTRVGMPFGIALLKDGQFVITDFGKNQISIHNRKGKCVRYWGKRGVADTHFSYPSYILVDKQDRIFVADTYNHYIKVFDSHGKFLTRLCQVEWLTSPNGICQDQIGNTLVCSSTVDVSKQTITVWALDGTMKTTLLERTPQYTRTSGQLVSVDMKEGVLAVLSNKTLELFKWNLSDAF